MQEAGATIKGVKKTLKWLEKNRAEAEKNMNIALRVEGFRLRKLMQREIKAGSPGGRRFAPLTDISKRMDYQKSPRRNPLKALAQGVRYHVNPRPPYQVAVGFVGPMTRSDADRGLGFVGRRVNQYSSPRTRVAALNPLGWGISRSNISSKKWRSLAASHQKGFSRTITEAQRRAIVHRGARLLGWDRTMGGKTSYKNKYGDNLEATAGNTPFFLKKSTKTLTTPARPIIAPFWQAHQQSIRRNIASNFKRKMAGQHI